jgi:small subunit ribosomal protein S13
MARISGVELQDNWKINYALTKIKGIGWPLSEKVLDSANITPDKRVRDLSSDEVSKIASVLEGYTIEGDLIRQVRSNVSRLQAVGTYRGVRHSRGLPVRGQRTKSNARAKRGKRQTVGAFRKEALTKMQQSSKEGGK